MTRTARALNTLVEEITALTPKAKIEVDPEPDGFDVRRSLRIGDKTSSKRLAPILDFLADSRIVEHHLTDGGYLHVTVSPAGDGDSRDPFMLRVAEDAMKDAPVAGDDVLRELPDDEE